MKLIELSKQGPSKGKYFAMVDDEDYERLSKYNYHLLPDENNLYARRSVYEDDIRKYSMMHQDITGQKNTDHKNKNGLDNQRHNLRPSTTSQNAMNKRKQKNASSKYKGVSLAIKKRIRKDGSLYIYKSWKCGIKVNGIAIHLGSHKTEEHAAIAYNKACEKYFGEFCSPNII
jgi:hypothetical protein